ncbi:MAG TPA: MarR family winged helix-turn-helix transcriptional regulator [Stellaceae bacterium]|jgi:DNA-binding MarR family transcriptional regulator|nr:MarR family winged helix-turn-helix transcriptional regulator [Stellaceae bacterium]
MAPPSNAVPIAPLRRGDDDAAGEHRPPSAALQPNIGALLHDVARLMRRRFERRARHTGLPITRLQAGALIRIARNEGHSQAKIAALMDIEPIALVRALDRLVEEGLVERRPHPTDRRVWTLWVMPKGWRLVERILEINQENREDALAGLSPSARDALLGALNHMKSNLASEDEGAEAV